MYPVIYYHIIFHVLPVFSHSIPNEKTRYHQGLGTGSTVAWGTESLSASVREMLQVVKKTEGRQHYHMVHDI